MRLKGVPWSIRSIIPTGLILVHHTLDRAEETAEVLAVRGYTHGGSLQPSFVTTRKDFIAGFFCLCAALIAFLPVSEFFILY
jgi:energy-coupling factor transporter transmembrane protein EcfT